MQFKTNISVIMQRMALHLKQIRLLLCVPAVVFFVIAALPGGGVAKNGYTEEALTELLRIDLMLMPFLSVWSSLFILKEYIEAAGNELLFVYPPRCKLLDPLLAFFGCLLIISCFFIGYMPFFPNMHIEWLRMLFLCVFYFGSMYCILFLSKSVTITLMMLLLYTLANLFFLTGEAHFPLYYNYHPITLAQLRHIYLPFLITGCVFTGVGVIRNLKTQRYN